MVTVLHHAKNRIRAMTVAPRMGLVGLSGQGNLGTDGSLKAVLRTLMLSIPTPSWISCALEQAK